MSKNQLNPIDEIPRYDLYYSLTPIVEVGIIKTRGKNPQYFMQMMCESEL
jgi:hypothetical protein